MPDSKMDNRSARIVTAIERLEEIRKVVKPLLDSEFPRPYFWEDYLLGISRRLFSIEYGSLFSKRYPMEHWSCSFYRKTYPTFMKFEAYGYRLGYGLVEVERAHKWLESYIRIYYKHIWLVSQGQCPGTMVGINQ